MCYPLFQHLHRPYSKYWIQERFVDHFPIKIATNLSAFQHIQSTINGIPKRWRAIHGINVRCKVSNHNELLMDVLWATIKPIFTGVVNIDLIKNQIVFRMNKYRIYTKQTVINQLKWQIQKHTICWNKSTNWNSFSRDFTSNFLKHTTQYTLQLFKHSNGRKEKTRT